MMRACISSLLWEVVAPCYEHIMLIARWDNSTLQKSSPWLNAYKYTRVVEWLDCVCGALWDNTRNVSYIVDTFKTWALNLQSISQQCFFTQSHFLSTGYSKIPNWLQRLVVVNRVLGLVLVQRSTAMGSLARRVKPERLALFAVTRFWTDPAKSWLNPPLFQYNNSNWYPQQFLPNVFIKIEIPFLCIILFYNI